MGSQPQLVGPLVGSHAECSIIPGGIPLGITPEKGGIPPGTHLGSQVGSAGSHLIFLPGFDRYAFVSNIFS